MTLNGVRQVRDVWTLLETNSGNYAAACSLDFSKPPNFYDTFALRDIEGHERLMMTYPYFRSRESRSAMISHRPVPVQSCWNGMGKPCPPIACRRPPLHATHSTWLSLRAMYTQVLYCSSNFRLLALLRSQSTSISRYTGFARYPPS